MPNYRLNKILRELNVSLDRAKAFLKSKNLKHDLKPISKIDDYTYEILKQEFGVNNNLTSLKNETSTKSIGFKNFRRFVDFPRLKLSNITYMVGRNNSGKSTMVKALILMSDYLQNQLSDTFSFDNLVLEDANVVTFDRALNVNSEEPFMSFNLNLNNFEIDVEISGIKDSTKGNVNKLVINDQLNGFTVLFNFIEGRLEVLKKSSINKVETNYKGSIIQIRNEIKELSKQKSIESKKKDEESKKEVFKITDHINRLRKKLENLTQNMASDFDKDDEDFLLESSLKDDSKQYLNNYFLDAIENFIFFNKAKYKNLKNQEADAKESIKNLLNNQSQLRNWASNFINTIKSQYFYYIGANPSKQSALFSIRDKDNALAQAIHKFKQLQISKGEEEDLFLKKWMKIFEVGEDYEILMRAGEAYEFLIYDVNKKVNLSDKGMGSLQAMTLILKITSLIRFNKKNKKQITILVEEPELNLHPALQSKLTDFFHEVNNKYGFDFIVETHSEYVIRRAQLLALQNDYLSDQNTNPNPFSIFYFHKEEGPYQMKFNDQGKFDREFGTGFYDEAGSLTLKMIKELRKNQAR